MKRTALERHLRDRGCALVREGARHSVWVNLANPQLRSAVPRHREIADVLVRRICQQLGIESP